MKSSHLFCTPTWEFSLDECSYLNNNIANCGYRLINKSPDLPRRSGSPKAWQSTVSCHTEPEIKDFLPFLGSCFSQISEDLSREEGWRLGLREIWINVNRPLSYNHPHTHNGSHISGVYVVKKPLDSGNFFMYDPRVQLNGIVEPKTTMGKRLKIYNMQEGDILFFPSWLSHSVDLNNSNEDRITISFNLNWTNK